MREREFRLYNDAGEVPGRLKLRQSRVTFRWFYRLTTGDGETSLFIPTLRGGRWSGFPSPYLAYRAAKMRLDTFRITVEEFRA